MKEVWLPVRRTLRQMSPTFGKKAIRAARISLERRAHLSRLFSTDSTVTGRSITYMGASGLGNRMRAHYIAEDFARRTGRQLVANWLQNDQCHSGIEDLFVWNGPRTLPRNARYLLVNYDARADVASPDLDAGIEAEHVILDITWQSVTRRGLRSRLGDRTEAARHFLVPRPQIVAIADEFTSTWPASMIGAHVRRGDFVTVTQQHLPLERYIVAIDRALAEAPAGTALFLASDGTDEELEPLLRAIKCPILRRPPASRVTVNGIEDALVTMLVLSRTRFNVLTPDSTFGDTACFLGNVPFTDA